MGNHHANRSSSGPTSASSSRRNSRAAISRTSSASDVSDRTPTTQLMPVEKLAKILSHKSHLEENVHGISLPTFAKYLFPRYPILADKLYAHFLTQSASKNAHLSSSAFRKQCEKFFALLDDDAVRDVLVRMFAESDGNTITPDQLQTLLMSAYHVAMDHYSEGPQMCLSINKTLRSVVDSCFHTKNQLSTQYVAHWLADNCPRLLTPLHRYAVHSLATSHRNLEENGPTLVAGLELNTPVLEQPPPFGVKTSHTHVLHMSMSWLLAGALPPLYSRPQKAQSPSANGGVGVLPGGYMTASYLSKLLYAVPSHWINLYDSDEHGLGANRFAHHVLAYKGASLVLMKIEGGQVFCVAAPCEWRESHLYWGGEECCVLQLLPRFALLESGSKMLYLNTSVRGYPMGLRAGKDPRAPVISVDKGFEKFEFRKIPYGLVSIEVWGCGDPASREVQLDIKKWQVREAEKQRCVKLSAADWMDHPDRYLLELAGRPQYHQKQT